VFVVLMLDQHLMVLEHRIDRRAGRVGEAVEPLRLPIMRSRVGMASSAMTMPLRGKRKKEKVALVAVMHEMLTRLNAMQRTGTVWNRDHVCVRVHPPTPRPA
jgi:hypothetical protein